MLAGGHRIRLERTGRTVTARHILIATGARPSRHTALEGHELCITSNEAFHLQRLPKKILIGGGGYIAVEFAGIFSGLGVDTTIVYRGREVLSRFDMDLRRLFHAEATHKGVRILCGEVFEKIEKRPDGGLRAHLCERRDRGCRRGHARGRAGAECRRSRAGDGRDRARQGGRDPGRRVFADERRAHLRDRRRDEPHPAHAGRDPRGDVLRRRPSSSGRPTKPDYDRVATAVFSRPEIGTVGLTEDAARERHQNLDIYKTAFRPLKGTLTGRSDRMLMKLVVDADTDVVLGAHVLGPGAGEMAQLLAIPVSFGRRRADFDATMAVHPTAAEELVTFSAADRAHSRRRGGSASAGGAAELFRSPLVSA